MFNTIVSIRRSDRSSAFGVQTDRQHSAFRPIVSIRRSDRSSAFGVQTDRQHSAFRPIVSIQRSDRSSAYIHAAILKFMFSITIYIYYHSRYNNHRFTNLCTYKINLDVYTHNSQIYVPINLDVYTHNYNIIIIRYRY